MQFNVAAYASSNDFCKIFEADMDRLYLLAFLLTGNAEQAERCFVEGLHDARNGNRVFKEWAWSRRMVIKNAIRAVRPSPSDAQIAEFGEGGLVAEIPQMRALMKLTAFERFVFVVTVLEGYSDRDCALLFGSTRQAVVAARVRALEVMGDPAQMREQLERAAVEKHVRSGQPLGISSPLLAATA